jgi:hypothetical protein
MQTIRFTGGDHVLEEMQPEANVRVIFELTAADRQALDLNAILERMGSARAAEVRTEIRILTDDRIRSDAIRIAKTDSERLTAYFLEMTMPEGDIERIVTLAEELQ